MYPAVAGSTVGTKMIQTDCLMEIRLIKHGTARPAVQRTTCQAFCIHFFFRLIVVNCITCTFHIMEIAPPVRDFDHQLKILIVGDSGVGKSSILLRFTDDQFNEAQFATIGVDYKTQKIQMDGKTLKLSLWDTAGQDRFRSLTQSYYRGAQGIILVYDCTVRQSFENMPTWLTEVQRNSNIPDAVKMLVANKIDKVNHMVSREEAESFAFDHSMLFIETSAKTRDGISHAFTELVSKILETPVLLQHTAPLGRYNVGAVDDSAEETGGGCSC